MLFKTDTEVPAAPSAAWNGTSTAPNAASTRQSPRPSTFPRMRWHVAPPDHSAAAELARQVGCSPVLAQVLLNRGFVPTDADAARSFLRPQLGDLIEPSLIPGLDDAAERLAAAIRNSEPIVIYGDYDVDGITATAILWHALTLLAGRTDSVTTYIPHRVDEGYGLNSEAITKLADAGAAVVVTVDCGITAIEQAALARDRGLDLIITDHHEMRRDDAGAPILPDARLVHPRLPGSQYGNPHLTGAGVAFKLAWEVGKRVTGRPRVGEQMRAFLMEAMALAALGTIADVAPLLGENRVLAAYGLGGLSRTQMRGLVALIESAGLAGKTIDSFHVGFLLGPRLNACGRMGHAELAVEMLTVAGPGRAREIADFLEKQNRQRQATERTIVQQAIEQVESCGYDADDCPAIVVDGQGWHVGVVGIVASRLVDRYNRPSIVLAVDGEEASGSGRSIDGFDLARSLAECGDCLAKHGGHAMAAGVSLATGSVAEFRERFTTIARGQITPEDMIRSLRADCEVGLGGVDYPLATELARLGPFGPGNRKPVLVLRGLNVVSARCCGKKGEHLQLLVNDPAGPGAAVKATKAIAFGCGDLAAKLRPGTRIDLAAEPQLNEWNGRVSVELLVKDLDIL